MQQMRLFSYLDQIFKKKFNFEKSIRHFFDPVKIHNFQKFEVKQLS